MNSVVRRFDARDAAAVGEILAASPEAAAWSVKSLEQLDKRGELGWVTEESSRVEGFIVVRAIVAEAEILNLGVAPERRRTGLAKGMLDEAIAELRRARVELARNFVLRKARISKNGAASGLLSRPGRGRGTNDERTHRLGPPTQFLSHFPLDASARSVTVRSWSSHPKFTWSRQEERMASLARNPRDILLDSDAEYQRLAEQHAQYESELQKITTDPYLSSEALVEEVNLKKMKLQCKDEMERIAARVHRAAAGAT